MTAESITCPECHRTSWNPNDVKEGYCGNCHWWTSDPLLAPHFAEVKEKAERAAAMMQETPQHVRGAIAGLFRAYRD